jgi:hypothetical protein
MATRQQGGQVTLQLTIPIVTDLGRRKASEMASAQLVIETPDGPKSIMPQDFTVDDMRQDANRIAAIEDTGERQLAVFGVIDSCMQLVRDAQELARNYVWIAERIDKLAEQLDQMEKIVITRVNHPQLD